MVTDETVTDDVLQEAATEIGLSLTRDRAASYVQPVQAILDSMQSLDRRPSRSVSADRIDDVEIDDTHNAFITQCRISREADQGEVLGVRVALKDNIAVAGVELTAGSGMLEGYVPERNAVVTERLLDAGATIFGKTNMDEFAFGPTGETSYFGPTENPVAPDHTPGGSSSGSAAAVAADHVDAALGTDTGGSVRIPASYCGIPGLKPTRGAIPTHGVIELAGSLDTVGVLASDLGTIEDCYDALSGATSQTDPVDLGAVELGVPDSLFDEPVHDAVVDRIDSAIDDLQADGATTRSVSLPAPDVSSPVWRAITMSELYQYFDANALPYRRENGRRPPFSTMFRGATSADVDRLSTPLEQYLLIGAYLVSREGGRRYARALDVRERLASSVETALETVDVIVSPTTPTPAHEFGEFSRDSSPPINNNTHLFNLSGHPALSIPCGTIDGLPIGLQVVGEWGADRRVLAVGRAIRAVLDPD